MSKVLLVDTNVSSAPIHKHLEAAGHEVHVVGGNPDDFLAKTAQHYIQLDYSSPGKLAALVEELAFDYVVPGCNDMSYAMCAGLGKGVIAIDSPEVTETINNKQLFRAFSNSIGLPVPQVYALDQLPQDRPLIVKPVDAFSGRGVTIIHKYDVQRIDAALNSARSVSRSGTCIVEDYVEGQLYSHSCFIAQGKVRAEFIVEEHGTANPFVVDTSRVTWDFPPSLLQRIRQGMEDMAQALQLVDGLIHTQFILSGEQFWIVEITRRCPGDLYSQLIELSTGFPYSEFYARPFVGVSTLECPLVREQSWIMRHTMSQPVTSMLGSLSFQCPIHIERLIPMKLAGDEIRESPYGRIALLFVRTNSQAELRSLFERTLRRQLYTVNG